MSAPVLSPAQLLAAELAEEADPYAALEAWLSQLTVLELAAFAYDWEGAWLRLPQIINPALPWRTWGYLTGRGYGKTLSISAFVNREVAARRARRIALIAQNLEKTIEVMVFGQSGLIATAPPWARPSWENDRLIWPNGAQAFPYTPEVPGALRGPEHDLAWASEFVAWPRSTRDEAISNLRYGLRLGYARMLWDTTPKRRHPTIRALLARSEKDPVKHVIVRGTSRDNIDNVNEDELEEREREDLGTQRGREELLGEYDDSDEGALWKDEKWFDDNRRDMPTQLLRRILIVDPAVSSRKGTDQTGIVDEGLGVDGQIYVIADLTGKHEWTSWGELVVERYVRNRCDCVIVERNRGGDAVAANIASAGRALGIRVEVVDRKAPTTYVAGVIYVKEVHSKRDKGARAEPVAGEYKAGRVSHVKGGQGLDALEDRMTTWVPEEGGESPDAIDATVHGIWELAQLEEKDADLGAGFAGLTAMQEALGPARSVRARARPEPEQSESTVGSIAGLLGGGDGWGEGL